MELQAHSDLEYAFMITDLMDSAHHEISDIKPSEWAEQNRIMTSDISALPGMFSYDNSPYTREIVDCLSPDDPAHTIAIKKGAQILFYNGWVPFVFLALVFSVSGFGRSFRSSPRSGFTV